MSLSTEVVPITATLELNSTHIPAYWMLTVAHVQLEEHEELLAACERGLVYLPDDPILLTQQAWANSKLGREPRLAEILAQLLRRREEGYFSAMLVAGCYLASENFDETFRWIERACDERDGLCPIMGRAGSLSEAPEGRGRRHTGG